MCLSPPLLCAIRVVGCSVGVTLSSQTVRRMAVKRSLMMRRAGKGRTVVMMMIGRREAVTGHTQRGRRRGPPQLGSHQGGEGWQGRRVRWGGMGGCGAVRCLLRMGMWLCSGRPLTLAVMTTMMVRMVQQQQGMGIARKRETRRRRMGAERSQTTLKVRCPG
jgi:hypothetical protein